MTESCKFCGGSVGVFSDISDICFDCHVERDLEQVELDAVERPVAQAKIEMEASQ